MSGNLEPERRSFVAFDGGHHGRCAAAAVAAGTVDRLFSTYGAAGPGRRHGVAELLGHGPLPLPLATEILSGSRGRKWWRRLFTAPHGGAIGGDSSRRCFDGTLATLIGYRDGGRCRDGCCDAPTRKIDHIVAARAGGPTSSTNGRATCIRTNQVREMPGWSVELVNDGLGDHPHTVANTTPTGHTCTSLAGPAP